MYFLKRYVLNVSPVIGIEFQRHNYNLQNAKIHHCLSAQTYAFFSFFLSCQAVFFRQCKELYVLLLVTMLEPIHTSFVVTVEYC